MPPIFIDAILRPDHLSLNENDTCLFFKEYRPNLKYDAVDNRLVQNFKKNRNTSSRRELQYKSEAINTVRNLFNTYFNENIEYANSLFVQIPPSKIIGDPGYDDRMDLVFRDLAVDYRHLIIRNENVIPDHTVNNRRSVEQILETIQINQNVLNFDQNQVVLVDDVLTVGRHFRACKQLILNMFPEVNVTGLFIARRVPEVPNPNVFDFANVDFLNI
ncbi:hypothetical protein QM480_06725 [Flectobacillus sp. DC10W]|uniref:Phosphoribosyltransferase domain-containing protein n=1 Tax=Flectobacillus longus TaxID=2984207 RepID=A0ABT6YKD2_9BACT|nr:hypothetical protein [Flectobacillus longus]MDI9864010.1 hypothetical protein [Flectobacillus longus]